jgi:hypothetical protein
VLAVSCARALRRTRDAMRDEPELRGLGNCL